MAESDGAKTATRLAHQGRQPAAHHGTVNTPVYHASTVIWPTLEAVQKGPKPLRKGAVQYGRAGTPTTFAFEEMVAELEGGFGACALPSGLAAIAGCYAAFLAAGDHVLVSDSVYQPNRSFCQGPLRSFGVEIEFFDPRLGGRIADLFRPETKLVFLESPGSLTFEVQDIPAIAEAAHRAGLLVAADNTWATPLYCRVLDLGADIAVHAGTKYFSGHSDLMIGAIVAKNEDLYQRIRYNTQLFGYCCGPDDLFLATRGLRTLCLRMARHYETALRLADWLAVHPAVEKVLYPARPDHADHDLWRRDFTGASGLFGAVLKPCGEAALAAMLNESAYFGMGYSWGGYESLCVPAKPLRTASSWPAEGQLLRFHAGLEDPDDLIADLAAGFDRLAKTEKSS